MAMVYPSAPEAQERDMSMIITVEAGHGADRAIQFLDRHEQLMVLRDNPVGAVFLMTYVVVKLGTNAEPLEYHQDVRYQIAEGSSGLRYEMMSLQQEGLPRFSLPTFQAPGAPVLIEKIQRVASQTEGPRLLSCPVLTPSPLDIHSWAYFICSGQLHRLLAQIQEDLGVSPLLGHQAACPEGKMPAPRHEQDKRFLAVTLGRAIDSVRWICEERQCGLRSVKAHLNSNECYFFVENIHCVLDQAIRLLFVDRFDRYWRLTQEGVPRTRAFLLAGRDSGKPDAGGSTGKRNERQCPSSPSDKHPTREMGDDVVCSDSQEWALGPCAAGDASRSSRSGRGAGLSARPDIVQRHILAGRRPPPRVRPGLDPPRNSSRGGEGREFVGAPERRRDARELARLRRSLRPPRFREWPPPGRTVPEPGGVSGPRHHGDALPPWAAPASPERRVAQEGESVAARPSAVARDASEPGPRQDSAAPHHQGGVDGSHTRGDQRASGRGRLCASHQDRWSLGHRAEPRRTWSADHARLQAGALCARGDQICYRLHSPLNGRCCKRWEWCHADIGLAVRDGASRQHSGSTGEHLRVSDSGQGSGPRAVDAGVGQLGGRGSATRGGDVASAGTPPDHPRPDPRVGSEGHCPTVPPPTTGANGTSLSDSDRVLATRPRSRDGEGSAASVRAVARCLWHGDRHSVLGELPTRAQSAPCRKEHVPQWDGSCASVPAPHGRFRGRPASCAPEPIGQQHQERRVDADGPPPTASGAERAQDEALGRRSPGVVGQRSDGAQGPAANPALPWQHRLPTRNEMYEGGAAWPDDDLPVLESGDGASLRLLHDGRRRKMAPSKPDNDLELAHTTSNLINLAALEDDSPLLKEVLAPIRSHKEFTKLFVATTVRRRRPLSRGMAKHDQQLHGNDVIEEVRFVATAAEMAEVAFAAYFMVWITTFLVAKKNGQGRLIGDARSINELQSQPADMGLPRVHDVIRQVLSFDYAAKTDGVSYFYQFELAEEIRPYFKVRLAGQRGQVFERMFKRLPMGWKFSPRIAQQTSNFLVRDCGVAWLDDFIVGGTSMGEYHDRRRTFLDRLQTYNVEVDNYEMEPTRDLEALGLQFDLVLHRYRLAPKWVDKRAPKLREVLDRARRAPITFREMYEMIGTLIWSSHVTNKPLWSHAEAMEALRQAAVSCAGDYDQPFAVPEYAHNDLSRWIDELESNPWHDPPREEPRSFQHHVFSDASTFGKGFVEVLHGKVVQEQGWSREAETEMIFLAELDACAVAARQTQPDPERLFCVDNSALNFAMKKGLSSAYLANTRLRATFGGQRPWSCWMPTHLMPADGLSRGDIAHQCPRDLNELERKAMDWIQQDAFGDPRNRSEKIPAPRCATDPNPWGSPHQASREVLCD